jgi:hypothetical protein
MEPARPVLYLDTCAILEATRARCWQQLAGRFDLHTVAECRNELASGNRNDRRYVAVDLTTFDASVAVHSPTAAHHASAQLKSASFARLDPGEKDLLAWCAAAAPNALILTTGDRAAIVSACELGLAENLQSLEEVAQSVGAKPELQIHFRKKWLSEIRTEALL